jgi:hypothetical protein
VRWNLWVDILGAINGAHLGFKLLLVGKEWCSSGLVMDAAEFVDFYQQQGLVKVSKEKIEEFTDSFHNFVEDFLKKRLPMRVPLNFLNSGEECDFFGVCGLLSVGSIFDHRCRREANQDHLSDIVLSGIFGAYISHSHLDTKFMKSVATSDAGLVLFLLI